MDFSVESIETKLGEIKVVLDTEKSAEIVGSFMLQVSSYDNKYLRTTNFLNFLQGRIKWTKTKTTPWVDAEKDSM